jgi:hypothetical protein
MLYVFDETGAQIYAQKVDITDAIRAICSIAGERNIHKVKLSGQRVYLEAWANEIKTAYSLNYGNNNLEVEII